MSHTSIDPGAAGTAAGAKDIARDSAAFPTAAQVLPHNPDECNQAVPPPWWLAGTPRRPFPRPLAYGFIRCRYGWEPIRFSIRPGPDDCWLFAWHPFPDTRVDIRLDLGTLLDRRALADKLARRGRGLWARAIRDNPDWRDWMLALLERGEGA